MKPLKVTFDSNVIQKVLQPDKLPIQGAPDLCDQQVVHEALEKGVVEGFVAKPFFTKEAISKRTREPLLRLNSRRPPKIQTSCDKKSSPGKLAAAIYNDGNNRANASTSSACIPRTQVLLLIMRRLNVHILHTFLCGDVSTKPIGVDGDCRTNLIQPSDYYQSDRSDSEIMERNNECFRFMQEKLKAGVLVVDWIDSKDGKRTPEQAERDLKFKNPYAEESDMQAIATHYAHGIDVFCTEDMGKSAGKCSVMRPENKEALATHFGICFCTLHELAERVRQLSNSNE